MTVPPLLLFAVGLTILIIAIVLFLIHVIVGGMVLSAIGSSFMLVGAFPDWTRIDIFHVTSVRRRRRELLADPNRAPPVVVGRMPLVVPLQRELRHGPA